MKNSRNGGKQSSAKTEEKHVRDSDGVVLLHKRNGVYDLMTVERSLEKWVGDNHSLLKSIFMTEDHSIIEEPEPVQPDGAEENPNSLAAKLYLQEMSEWKRKKADRVRCYEAVYTKLDFIMDEELKAKVEATDEYPDVRRRQRPDLLYILMKECALSTGIPDNKDDQKDEVRSEYTAFRQINPYEPLPTYKRRMEFLKVKMEAADCEIPEQEMAWKWIKGLHRSIYGNLITDVKSGRETKPLTLQAALITATNWLEIHRHDIPGRQQPTAREWAAFTSWRDNGGGKADPAEDEDKSTEVSEEPRNQRNQRRGMQCHNCRGYGHKRAQCPSKKFANVSLRAYAASDALFDLNKIFIYDNAANHCIVTPPAKAHLTNIMRVRKPSSTTGLTGNSAKGTERGRFYDVPVYVSKESVVNVLADCDMAEHFACYKIEGWGIRTIHRKTGQILDFLLDGGVYLLHMDHPERLPMDEFRAKYDAECKRKAQELADQMDHFALVTVTANESQYTSREVKKAKEARRLLENSAYQSPAVLQDMLSHGSIRNAEITPSDMRNAHAIYGVPIPALKGKTRKRKPKIDANAGRQLRRDVRMDMDIAYIMGEKFLVSITTPIHVGMVQHLKSSKTNDIKDAITKMLAVLKAYGVHVSTVGHDPESGLAAAMEGFEFIPDPCDAGAHVPVVENLIKQLKETVRAVVHGLDFILPPSLVTAVVIYALKRRNLVYTKASSKRIPPIEDLTGRPVDAKVDLALKFGDYCQIYAGKEGKNNTMHQRTVGAIAMYPVGNRSGSWAFYGLRTGKILRRAQFTLLPTSDVVVEFMENKAVHDIQLKPGMEEEFRRLGEERALEYDVSHGEGPAMTTPPLVDGPDSDDDTDDEEDEAPVVTDHTEDAAAIPERADDEPPALVEDSDVEDDADNPPVGYARDVPLRVPTQPSSSSAPEDDHSGARGDADELVCCVSSYAFVMTDTPKRLTRKMAMKKFGQSALDASVKEIKQIDDKGTWQPVDLASLSKRQFKNVIRAFLFLKEKFRADGVFEKLKARLVAMGNQMDPDNITIDTSAPTVMTASAFAVAAIAAKDRRSVMTIDVGGAFLIPNMPPGEEVYVRLDKIDAEILCQLRPEYRKYLNKDGTICMKLLKALYGLVISAKLWYNTLSEFLRSLGYVPNKMDPCVFNLGPQDEQCTVLFHVDDIMATCTKSEKLDALAEALKKEYSEIVVHRGKKHSYLGMMFDFTKDRYVTITMEPVIQKLIDEVGVTTTSRSPAGAGVFNVDEKSKKLSKSKREKFHSVTQSLLYVGKRVRWEILLPVSFLTTRVQSPDEDDWRKLLRVVAYLKGTVKLGLRLGGTRPIAVKATIDASYGVHASGKSHSGMATQITGVGTVLAKSTKQKLTTKSSTESEIVALSDMSSDVIGVQQFLVHQGYDIENCEIGQDNQACMMMMKKGRPDSSRTRHIDIRFFYLSDRIASGSVQLKYVNTNDMTADILTKPLQGSLFERLRDVLLGIADE